MPLRTSFFVRLSLPLVALGSFAGACSSSTPADPGQAGAGNVAGTGQTSAGAPGAGSAGMLSSAGSGAAGSGGMSVVGAAGSGGAPAAAGSAGATSSAGASGNSGGTPSTGCGMPAAQELGKYVKYAETVPGVEAKWQARNYYVYLPKTYNPARVYPTVFVGPGCGGTGDMGIPIMNAAGEDAIVIGLDPDPTAEGRQCFQTESYPDPEENYFNETLKQVEAKYCIDKSKIFVEGFSSGSWLANLIGCVDGDIIRGQGNASGCMQGGNITCKGPVAYMGVHDSNDPNNSYQCGKDNKDRIKKLNGCTEETIPYDPGPMITIKPPVTISCVQYVGCKPGYPVIWCTTTNLGHNDQVATGMSTFGFWKFWNSLPPKTP